MSAIVQVLRTIFSVDDDENDNLLLQAALNAAGFDGTLEFAADGEEAIQLLSRSDRIAPPDVVLLDLNMPRRDGFECLKWLRSREELRSVPVAMFTTSSHPEEVAKAYDLGADLFLVKPLTYDDLLDLACALGDCIRVNDRAFSRLRETSAFRDRPAGKNG